jgi:hypothetical protein
MSMNARDRQAIEQLFARLADVERQSPPRDAEAESFIARQMARQPGSAYYMAQSILALEQALDNANQRLEQATQEGSRGSLMPGSGSVPRVGPAGGPPPMPPEASGGPGFLAGALQTAIAVAGGTLLGNSIGSIFGADKAKASETRREDPAPAADHGEEDDDGDYEDEGNGGGGFLDSIFGGGDEN